MIVYATGFDALTGALTRPGVAGRAERLTTRGPDGPRTYLGLSVPGFPNLFTITGPGSPGVSTNVPVAIEQHVEWIAELLGFARERGHETIEADAGATDEWTAHVQDVANDDALSRPPTAGTWARTSPASRGCSCRTSAGWTCTGARATRSRRPGYPGSGWRASTGADAPGRWPGEPAVALDEATAALVARVSADGGRQPHGSAVAEAARLRQEAAARISRQPGHCGVIPVAGGDDPGAGHPAGRPPRAVIVFYHAGGWVLGGLDECEAEAGALAERTGCVVVCPSATGWRPSTGTRPRCRTRGRRWTGRRRAPRR